MVVIGHFRVAWKWTCKRKNFYINSFAPRLVPTQRQKPNWEWPIKYSHTFVFIAIYYIIYCSQSQLTTATRRYCSSAWLFKRDLIYPWVIFRANPDVYFFNRGFISPLVINMTRLLFLYTAKARNTCHPRSTCSIQVLIIENPAITVSSLFAPQKYFCNWSSKNVLWSYRNMLRLNFVKTNIFIFFS